jgi:hypothetical protein
MKVDIKRIMMAAVFSIGTMAAADVTQRIQTKEAKMKEVPAFEMTMKCSFTPQADEQTSALPTYPLGFIFSKEINNNGQIGVDIFKTNDVSKPVKLIGHAELNAGDFSLADDSPFDFELVLPENKEERFAATVTVMTTFNNEYFSNLSVLCRQVTKASSSTPTTSSVQ